MNYLILSFITLIAWGVWGIFSKLSTKYYKWYEYYILSTAIAVIISIILFFNFKKFISFKNEGFLFLLFATLTGAIGFIAFYLALSKGKASIIVPLTSLYPAITIILAKFFLKEKINAYGYIGILLAVIAIFLLSKSS